LEKLANWPKKLKKTDHLKELRDFFEKNIKLLGGVIFAEASPRVSNTSFFGFPNIDGATLITVLDKHGIGIASGSACSSNNKEPSHVLLAMGIEDQQAQSAVRLSLGDQNTKEDIVFLLEKIKLEVNRLLTYTSILN
jgi:cysteine desulfurase